ncbi:MAG: ferredoxin family protein [Candidatus Omnitrophica bacterium]|nr:ferredoxin family protein [Candidatus Omnitrophota bacterium]
MVKKQAKKVHIYEDFCKGCGLCVFFCPDKALSHQKKFNIKGFHPAKWKGSCSLCGKCFIVCPDFAIEVK